jgi:hypothetical protein
VAARFDAVALDPHRPLPPSAEDPGRLWGAVGIAVVVVAHLTLADVRTGRVLARRDVDVGQGAAVLVSVTYAVGHWLALAPYLRGTGTPATPGDLLALA